MTDLLIVGSNDDDLTTALADAVSTYAPDWSLRRVAEADAAVDALDLRPADLVLACLEDDVDAYAKLFGAVADASLHTLRFALFRPGAELPPRVEHAHQVLAAREHLDFLGPVLAGAAEVADRARRHGKLEKIISGLHDVPSPPTLYFDIREALEHPSADLDAMAKITARDPSLVARVLKIANSGFYALPRSVADLSEAIGLIGTDALLGLVLAAHLYSGLPPPGLKLERLWEHTTQVSALARLIAEEQGGNRSAQGESAVAGLLHDIGLMVLLENESMRYQPLWRQCRGDESLLADMERGAFGVTHGELGALILKLWSLPDSVVDAVANSHAPAEVMNEANADLALPSRAVLAAEWLLDQGDGAVAESLPKALGDVTGGSLERWYALREDIESPAVDG